MECQPLVSDDTNCAYVQGKYVYPCECKDKEPMKLPSDSIMMCLLIMIALAILTS